MRICLVLTPGLYDRYPQSTVRAYTSDSKATPRLVLGSLKRAYLYKRGFVGTIAKPQEPRGKNVDFENLTHSNSYTLFLSMGQWQQIINPRPTKNGTGVLHFTWS